VLTICLAATIAGCGGSTDIPISGEVTLDGRPVAGPATIAFYPEPGTNSPNAGGEIVDGKYSIPAEKGPSTGKFRVEITWPKKTGKQIPSVDPGMMTDETFEAIPAKYNSNSELNAEVSPTQTVHSFQLQSR
jgi:hypothetical protein